MNSRRNEIEDVLSKLRRMSKDSPRAYAVCENIAFFEASRSLWRYVMWLLTRGLRLCNTEDLLEINELLPEYDALMHRELAVIERRKYPGLVEPLITRIIEEISKCSGTVKILGLGSGSAEIERQIIERLPIDPVKSVVFVCIDRSDGAHEFARENLSEHTDTTETRFIEKATSSYFDTLVFEKPILILQCKNDLFTLGRDFPEHFFDVSYHSFLRHHLLLKQVEILDTLSQQLSKVSFAYDGFRSVLHLVPQTLTAWDKPIFLNASVFSNLRYHTRRALKKKYRTRIRFFAVGTCLVKY